MPDRITLSQLRDMANDIDVPDETIAQYLVEERPETTAFRPRVTLNTEVVDDQGLEADIGLPLFNHWDKRRRQRRYRRKISGGWNGLKVVSEGDSWFQYPFLLRDVIDHLFDDYAIYSLGAAGDLVSEMLNQDEILAAIQQENPDLFFFSGGGNDLLGDGRLSVAVHPYDPQRQAEDYPNAAFGQSLAQVINDYRTIFDRIATTSPDVRILCHGYDYARPDDGRWLGRPLAQLGITDTSLQADIVREMINRFNTALAALADEFPGIVYRVDCLNAVAADRWHDELHPNAAGYGAVADRFRTVVNSIAGRRGITRAKPAALCPGREAMIDARDLTPKAFRELVDHRGRALLSLAMPPTPDEDRRRKIESDISAHFEKISGGADFLPARFLKDGADRATSVCRIRLSSGVGTGFLISTPNFIMTNNHVLESAQAARSAVAEFHFEDGGTGQSIPLDPDRFFVTSADLDFTIVGCDGSLLDGVAPIALLRSPSTVTRSEKVNIIQHPRGRPKEVALHDNSVQRIKDKVIWYTTDTEPGSSGSPVFNNTWDLVALHHAGWHNADGSTTNEGVRIAAIVSHLIAQQNVEHSASGALGELLATIPDSSPHLGFFDIVGITGSDRQEVEVPEYRGSVDFADVGFWNIEHFNDAISDERVNRVADVLAHLSMDALGLIEVQRGAMDRLVSALQALGYPYDYKYLNVRGRQDLAVLYDSQTTSVTLAQDIMNRHGPAWSTETASGRSAFPRRPLIARIKISPREGNAAATGGDVEFIMISVHLKAFGDPESRARRKLAARVLTEVIEDIRETEKLPVVLGGDLNETLNTDVLSALTTAPDLITLTSDDQDDNALSYVGARHRSLIDHIVVSDDVRMSPISGDDAAIVRLDRSVADFTRDISDHVPLVIRMIQRDAPLDIDPAAPADEGLRATVPRDATSVHLSFE